MDGHLTTYSIKVTVKWGGSSESSKWLNLVYKCLFLSSGQPQNEYLTVPVRNMLEANRNTPTSSSPSSTPSSLKSGPLPSPLFEESEQVQRFTSYKDCLRYIKVTYHFLYVYVNSASWSLYEHNLNFFRMQWSNKDQQGLSEKSCSQN